MRLFEIGYNTLSLVTLVLLRVTGFDPEVGR